MLRSISFLLMISFTCGQKSPESSKFAQCHVKSYALYQWNAGLSQWKRTPINMGEFHLTATFERCERITMDTVLLSGDVHYPYPSKGHSLTPAAGVRIWRAERVSDDVLTRSTQLGVTDSLGRFNVRVHDVQRVVFVETDTTGIGYAIE